MRIYSPYFRNMFRELFTLRALLALIAILIVSGTILYSSYLAKKIEIDERTKVEQWIEASNSLFNPANTDTRLPFRIIQENRDMPIIAVYENDSIIGYKNLDSAKAEKNPEYLREKLEQFRDENPPIRWVDPLDTT